MHHQMAGVKHVFGLYQWEQTKRWSKIRKMTIHSINLSVQVMLWINTDKIWKWRNDNNYNS